MFARKFRLRHRQDIDFIMKRGERLHSAKFAVWFLMSPTHHYRFTVIVGKKCEKSAVKRNRIKRIMREALRILLMQKFPNFPNIDAIFWIRHENTAETFIFNEVAKEAEIALEKLQKIAMKADFGKIKSRHH
ncbi:MAG: ribonuclease P protein component [Patescibacteria group bacterium]|nr:ribonuclease P protein component [Patescibacteria group bacterium]